jgi:hypothetical protein
LILGIGIGFLIGIVSATVALVLLKTANSAAQGNLTGVVTITAEILAIPTFWFGGPWVTSSLLGLVELQDIINPYIVALSLTFPTIMMYPIYRWIIRLGQDLGKEVHSG